MFDLLHIHVCIHVLVVYKYFVICTNEYYSSTHVQNVYMLNFLNPKYTTGRKGQYAEGESPIDYLTHASQCLATAIKHKGKDAALHHQLAMVLEERYYAEDTFGLKTDCVNEHTLYYDIWVDIVSEWVGYKASKRPRIYYLHV